MFVGAKPDLFKHASNMRKNPTEAEKKLWKYLRNMRSDGFIFRRQHPIDIFIADFYCHKLKLVIEVDGEIHEETENREYDDGRSGELEKYEIKVIRFRNEEIINNQELVIKEIQSVIKELASPSLLGEGDGRG